MKKILLFGAGKSASVLIEYLLEESVKNNWKIIIADANKGLVEEKTKQHPHSEALGLDILDENARQELILNADIVISMMPPSLHIYIAKDCIRFGKNLLTASYKDEAIKALEEQVRNRQILFLCEMGLDPGIDHMSAMQLLDRIKAEGGTVTSFKSHCGGLIAPESDDNPWHYKITWNPRNVVLAGKAGAIYKMNGKQVSESYENLFNGNRKVETGIEEVPVLSYYPNRDSLPYMELYGLQNASTFIRTTLRYPAFMSGWKNIVDLKLTEETPAYQTNGKSLKTFFDEFLPEDNRSAILNDATAHHQFYFLGREDGDTMINKGFCSASDVLQFALEKKLALYPADKDMIVMLHEIEYTDKKGNPQSIRSSLLVKGKDSIHTAMAKTVGLPLGIAAKLILDGSIQLTGVHIPVLKEIYEPVLEELKKQGVTFIETETRS